MRRGSFQSARENPDPRLRVVGQSNFRRLEDALRLRPLGAMMVAWRNDAGNARSIRSPCEMISDIATGQTPHTGPDC